MWEGRFLGLALAGAPLDGGTATSASTTSTTPASTSASTAATSATSAATSATSPASTTTTASTNDPAGTGVILVGSDNGVLVLGGGGVGGVLFVLSGNGAIFAAGLQTVPLLLLLLSLDLLLLGGQGGLLLAVRALLDQLGATAGAEDSAALGRRLGGDHQAAEGRQGKDQAEFG